MTNNRLSAFRRWDVVGWILRWYNLPSEIRWLLADLQLIPDYSQEILSGLEFGLRRPGNQPPRYRKSEIFPSVDQTNEVSS